MDKTFEKHFVKSASCWLWIGVKTWGYGIYNKNKRNHRAHRYAYELYVGPIPEGLVIDHLCRVRGCVNPKHLEPVTQAENLYRGDTIAAFARSKTHCKHGHPFDEENTLRHNVRGTRVCRICKNARKRKYWAER